MRIRIISSIVGIILLITVIVTHKVIVAIATSAIALMGIYEFYKAFENNTNIRPFKILGYIISGFLSLLGFNSIYVKLIEYIGFFKTLKFASAGLYVLIVLLILGIIFLYKKYNIVDISVTLFGILYVPFLLSFIIFTRNIEPYGVIYVWLIFIGAFATDTTAYFVGVFLGRTKVIPDISPKKTVEGSIGGVIGCLIFTIAYGLIVKYFFGIYIEVWHFVLLGIINGVVAQIGDWSASAIKRFTKIKDFGYIMPGHGGILDRFDSILLISPIIYFYVITIY